METTSWEKDERIIFLLYTAGMPACLPVELEEGDTKCQMPPKLQSGYNGYVVHTHGQRPTANVADQKKIKKKEATRKISCRQLMFCDPLETRPELCIKETYY